MVPHILSVSVSVASSFSPSLHGWLSLLFKLCERIILVNPTLSNTAPLLVSTLLPGLLIGFSWAPYIQSLDSSFFLWVPVPGKSVEETGLATWFRNRDIRHVNTSWSPPFVHTLIMPNTQVTLTESDTFVLILSWVNLIAVFFEKRNRISVPSTLRSCSDMQWALENI